MLIVEELHLLFLRPDGRDESAVLGYRAYGEIAAVLIDLLLHERITLTDDKHPRVHVSDASPTGHPVLDAALSRLEPLSGKPLSSLVARTKLDPRNEVTASLIGQGVLTEGERGFFGRVRTPEADPAPEAHLRARLAGVIAGTAAPSTADRTLLGIIQGMSLTRSLLRAETEGLSGRQVRAAITRLTEADPAGGAVGSAVDSVTTTAVMAALTPIFAATAVAAAGG